VAGKEGTMSKLIESIAKEIFPKDARVFAIFDGASVEDLMDSLDRWKPPIECLYRGGLEPDMAEVAPYLVELAPGSEIAAWSLTGWGKHWGVFLHADLKAMELVKHFGKFVHVLSPENKRLLFRFYDPRVLRGFLPTCTESEISGFFGPVKAYFAEGEDPQKLYRFTQEGGRLKTEVIEIKES
jgi:hypothetical protein